MGYADQRSHFQDLIGTFDTGMLVTRERDGELHGRPMAVVEVEPGGDVWFVTSVDSPKISEIGDSNKVAVTFQSAFAFVSLTGHAQIVRDHARIQEMWRERWRVWFPKGPDQEDLVLIRVRAEHGEYWDNRGTRGVRFLFDAARSYVTGRRLVRRGREHHAHVDLHD